MMRFNETFNRVEKKYLLTEEQYEVFMSLIREHVEEDQYYFSNILNIYFDTDDFEVIRHSIEKPPYKEKLRLRSYGVPGEDTNVFIELKKKFKGRVYKRRISLPYNEAMNYFENGAAPQSEVNAQIFREIDFFIKRNHVKPMMFVAYDRYAYVGKDNNGLRITIDENLRNREENLELGLGQEGNKLFEDNKRVVEIKALGAYPRWLIDALNANKIYPTSFSKYGTFYKNKVIGENSEKSDKFNNRFNTNTKKKEAVVCLTA